MVRTRADADTIEARRGDYSRWQAALASCAHVISTDYYEEDPSLKTGYKVRLPGQGAGRWNTLLLPAIRPLPELEPKAPARRERSRRQSTAGNTGR
jgi:hypothetical protein